MYLFYSRFNTSVPSNTFGLYNAAHTFLRFMDTVMYANEGEHLQHLQIIFERFATYELAINPSKRVFGAIKVQY